MDSMAPASAPPPTVVRRTEPPPPWFSTPGLDNTLGTLLNVARTGTFVAVVKGDEGMGKTALMEQLAWQLQGQSGVLVVTVRCSPGHSVTGELVRDLDVDLGEPGMLVSTRIIQALARLRADGTAVVLLVDDAHHMEVEDLALLIRLSLAPNAERGGLLQMVLFARPEIVSRLAELPETMPSGRLLTLVPSPYNRQQVRDYLAFRLRLQGVDFPPALRDATLTAIHQRSAGIPGRLNREVERLIRHKGRRIIPPLLPLAASAVLVLGAGAGWWLLAAGGSSPDGERHPPAPAGEMASGDTPVLAAVPADAAGTPSPPTDPVHDGAQHAPGPATAALSPPPPVPPQDATAAMAAEPAVASARAAATDTAPVPASARPATPPDVDAAAPIGRVTQRPPRPEADTLFMPPRPTLRATVAPPIEND